MSNNPSTTQKNAADSIALLEPKQRAVLYTALKSNMELTQATLHDHIVNESHMRPALHKRIKEYLMWSCSEQLRLIIELFGVYNEFELQPEDHFQIEQPKEKHYPLAVAGKFEGGKKIRAVISIPAPFKNLHLIKSIMTYREKIQDIISRIELIYDECEGLRDIATEDEKKAWNDTRGIFYDAGRPLQKLDNSLSTDRAAMKI